MAEIEKGSEAAQATYRLFQTWVGWDEGQVSDSEVEVAFDSAMAYASEVVFNLILIVGGMVNTIAGLQRRSFDDALADVWRQLAPKGGDNRAAEVMRAAVTAWHSGSAADADFINEAGMLNEAEPQTLMMHFLGVWTMLARKLTEHAEEPMDNALEGLRRSLGA